VSHELAFVDTFSGRRDVIKARMVIYNSATNSGRRCRFGQIAISFVVMEIECRVGMTTRVPRHSYW